MLLAAVGDKGEDAKFSFDKACAASASEGEDLAGKGLDC